jgi:hypothetical protein
MIIGYRVVCAGIADELAESVMSFMAEGWQPFGSIAMTCDPCGSYFFSQAMVKYA